MLQNNNFQALTYLRKKKEIEKRVVKQLSSLDNVQSLISRIEESKYNSEVIINFKNDSIFRHFF